jgi:hypothetical protein
MSGENYFVQRRRMQKKEFEKIITDNKDLTTDQLVIIMAKRTGLKHSTVRIMYDEILAEMD